MRRMCMFGYALAAACMSVPVECVKPEPSAEDVKREKNVALIFDEPANVPPHAHTREKARRLRQLAKKEARNVCTA